MESTLYIALGIGLMVFSFYVEVRHKRIWDSCKPKQSRAAKGFITYVTTPNKFSYIMNIYLIWPVVFVLGVFCLITGIELMGK